MTARVYEVQAPPGAELCPACNHQVAHHGYNGCFHVRVYSDGPMKMSVVCSCERPWGVEAADATVNPPPQLQPAYNTQPLASVGEAIALAWAHDATFARGALLEYE